MRKKRFFLVGLHHYIPQFYVELISLIQALLLNQIFFGDPKFPFCLGAFHVGPNFWIQSESVGLQNGKI